MSDNEFEDKKVQYASLVNLESLKRDYFNNLTESFMSTLYELYENKKVFFYVGKYKYHDEYDGRPYYIAKNRVNGFERSFQDYRKYLFTKFSVSNSTEQKYEFKSFWIVNSTEFVTFMQSDEFDDFEFVETNYETISFEFSDRTDSQGLYVKFLH